MSWALRVLRRAAMGLVAVLGFTAVLVAIAWGILATEWGRDSVAQVLADSLSAPDAVVTIQDLEGPLPQHIGLRGVAISDARGPRITVDSLSIDWSPWGLLQGRIHVRAAEASRIEILRSGEGETDWAAVARDVAEFPYAVVADRLSVQELSLGEAILGEPAAIRVEATLASRAGAALRTELTIDRVDGRGGGGHVRAVLDVASERLDLDARIEEPAGGVLAGLLDIPTRPPLAVTLSGEGVLSDWRGKLSARAEGRGSINAEIGLSGPDPIRIHTHGSLEGLSLEDETLRAWLAPGLEFDLAAGWKAGPRILGLDHVRMHNALFEGAFAGSIALGEMAVGGELSFATRDPSALNGLLEPLSVTRGSLTAKIDGPLMQPVAQTQWTLEEPDIEDIRAKRARAAVTVTADRPLTDAGLRIGLDGTIETEGFETGDPIAQTLLGPAVRLDLHGDYDLDGGLLATSDLSIVGAALTAHGSGTLAIKGPSVDLATTIDLPDLTRLPLESLPITGGRAEITVYGRAGPSGVDGVVTAELGDLAYRDVAIGQLLGPAVAASADIAGDTASGWRLANLAADARTLQVSGDAQLAPDFARLDSRFRVAARDLRPFSELAETPLAGTLEIRGTAIGDPMDPALEGTLFLSDLVVSDFQLGTVTGDVSIERIATEPQGRLALASDGPEGEIRGHTAFAVEDGKRLRLQGLDLRALDTTVLGELTIPLAGGATVGRLSVAAADLTAVAARVGLAASGAAEGTVSLQDESGNQAVQADLRGFDLRVEISPEAEVTAEELRLTGELGDLASVSRFTGQAVATKVTQGDLSFDRLTGEIGGTLADAGFRLEGSGERPGNFSAEGRLKQEDDSLSMTLASFQGRMAGQDARLRQPARLVYGPRRIAVEDLDFEWAGGRVQTALRWSPADMEAKLRATALPLSLLRLVMPDASLDGHLNAHVDLAGPTREPAGDLLVEVTDLTLADPVQPEAAPPPLGARLAGRLEKGQISLQGRMSGLADTALEVAGSLPVALSFHPPDFELPTNLPIEGQASFRGDLQSLWTLFPIDPHRLRGRGEANIEVAGTLAQPVIQGAIGLRDGAYENLETGTQLSEIVVSGDLEGRQLILREVMATDGGKGRLTGSGAVELAPERDFPVRIDLALADATLIARDDVTAAASGDLSVTGTLGAPMLKGAITAQPVEVRLVGGMPASVVTLDVTEVNAPARESRVAEPTEDVVVGLDLALSIPRRLFVRGRGLDSEWAGDFEIGGTSAAPVVKGLLYPVRGDFSLAGKIFKFQEGSITFDGGAELVPALDLTAEYATSDLTAVIRVRGAATAPEITLESRPDLPQEEILSRVLFNRGTGQISPMEAAQLAAAAAELGGIGGSGPGVLDRARALLGVDVLRFGAAEGSAAPNVTAGRYVADGVYVGVTQGTTANSTAATVGVEVTPNIAVESDVGSDARGRVGVRWKYDY